MKVRMAWLLASLLAPLCAGAQEIRELSLDEIELLGREIYRRDMSAAVATDVMLAQNLDLDEYPLRGWVVTEDESGPLVTFIGEYDGVYKGLFDVRPDPNATPRFRMAEQRRLTDEEAAQFRARSTAQVELTEPCSERYNSVVLEDPGADGWIVYWLAATVEAGVIPMGGHYRVMVSADGNRVVRADRLSVSCMMMDKSQNPDGETAALVFTHLVGPTPVETHVFLSLQHRLPFVILTGEDEAWIVADGEIEPFDVPAPPQ